MITHDCVQTIVMAFPTVWVDFASMIEEPGSSQANDFPIPHRGPEPSRRYHCDLHNEQATYAASELHDCVMRRHGLKFILRCRETARDFRDCLAKQFGSLFYN